MLLSVKRPGMFCGMSHEMHRNINEGGLKIKKTTLDNPGNFGYVDAAISNP
jgi:hypothetical protein